MIEHISNQKKISLPTIEVNSNRQAFKTCIEQLATHEFVWLQFYLSSEDDDDDDQMLNKLNKYVKKIYQNLREDSIMIGIFSGEKDRFSRCFVRIKDEEKLTPLIIDGNEYPYDLKLVKNK